MMYRIGKSFKFDAAHRLVAPYEGKCACIHGHTWRVDVVVKSETLNPCGMVVDFTDLAPIKAYIDEKFDHAMVNDTVEQPTCENIARHLYDYAITLFSVESVRVWESATSWAEFAG
jgi:6-pyruvoyltetrahydropterin/6-carboxytetrahydropterin synthase